MNSSNHIRLLETTSTNDWLKQAIRDYELPHGFYVSTAFQTNGHGQASNKWESERGKNILFSLLIKPDKIEIYEQFLLTEIITIAIQETLQPLSPLPISIKWPNDIYAGDKKICGMLIENIILGNTWEYSIAGIGININQNAFISNAPNPISLKQICNKEYDCLNLLENTVNNILTKYQSEYSKDNLHNTYMSKLYRRDGFYRYETSDGEPLMAKIANIGPMGHMTLLCDNNESRTFAFKEVKFILD